MKLTLCVLLLLFISCGRHETYSNNLEVRDTKIFGGKPVEDGKWQNVVAFSRVSLEGELNSSFCSGTLIRSNLVLTAAHCVRSYNENNIHEIVVTDKNISITNRDYFFVEKIELHPFYNPLNEESNYDFALVTLKSPVPDFTPIKIDLLDSQYLSNEVTLVGFGKTDEGFSGLKHEVNTFINSKDLLTFNAGGGGKDTCSGDSGGPVFGYDQNGKVALIGVTSHASTSARKFCGDQTVYGKAILAHEWYTANKYLDDSLHMSPYSALVMIDSALALLPNYPRAFLEKSYVLIELKRDLEALEVLEKLVKLKSDNIKAWIQIASIYKRLKRNEREAEALKKILMLQPEDTYSFNRLSSLAGQDLALIAKGIGLFKQGHEEDAKIFLKPFETFDDAKFILAFISSLESDEEATLEQLNQINKVDPFVLNLRNNLGDSLLLRVSFGQNLEIVKRLVELGSDVNLLDQYGNTTTHLAWWRKSLDVLEYLITQGAQWNPEKYEDQFINYISTEDIVMVKFLLKYGKIVSCEAYAKAIKTNNGELIKLIEPYALSCLAM